MMFIHVDAVSRTQARRSYKVAFNHFKSAFSVPTLPLIEPNTITNNGGSLSIVVVHICTTTGQRSGIGGYTITPGK